MKFRNKVLFINIILLSLGLGLVGYLIIDQSFQLGLDTQIQNAIEENNIIQANIEYLFLESDGPSSKDISKSLQKTAEQYKNQMVNSVFLLNLVYDSEIIYSDCPCPEALWRSSEMGTKKYIICEEDAHFYIYVTSHETLDRKILNIINRREITSVFGSSKQQILYFRYLLLGIVILCSIIMFITSLLLTSPLEKLSKISKAFGEGDYSARANIQSSDEIGTLAMSYNQMADSVEQHMKDLGDLLQRKDQFVSDFSHEVKTPLTSIIGYSDLLRSQEVSREAQIMASSYIFSEAKRLEAMSMKLFDLIYNKQHDITPVPFYTLALNDRVRRSVEPALSGKQLSLTGSFENVSLSGDLDLLCSAFINLIDNARKASFEGGEILFEGKPVQNSYQITVEDHGIGIPKEHLEHICDEFFMVDKSRSRSEGGSGLGLSLAALIFRSHKATLDIQSTPGQGTRITVLFPILTKEGGPVE